MILQGEHNGYTVQASAWNGRLVFRCDALGSKEFDSSEKIEKAIDAYDLSLRKQFSNRIAYTRGQFRVRGERPMVEQVEITSIDDTYAWIKRNGKREKERRDALFADRDAFVALIVEEQQLNKMLAQKWDELKRWEPVTEPVKP